jgi:uncharacterized membrane protein
VTRSTLIRALFLACIGLYPVFVFFGLSYLPPSFFGIALLVLLAMRYGVLLPEERPVLVPLLAVFVTYALVAAVSGSEAMLLYYPAVVNFGLCGVFLNSLRQGDPLLLRIIRARGWPMSEHAPIYLYRLTAVWAAFFVANGLVSIWTTTLGIEAWTLYNGFLSYVAVAVFVGIEYTFRRWYKRRMGVDEA